MPITTTIHQITKAMPAIQKQLAVSEMPPKASLMLGNLSSECQKQLDTFYKKRDALFEQAGCVFNEKTGLWGHKKEEIFKECVAKASEMADAEVELSCPKLNLDYYGSTALPGAAFHELGWAVKEMNPE